MPSVECNLPSRHLHPLLGLALCAVGLAGCPAPTVDGSDIATGGASSSGGSSGTDADLDEASTTGTTTGAATTEDPQDAGSSGSSGELPAPTGPGADACATYCERREACIDEACDEEFCAVTVDYVQAQGEDCIAAYEAWIECLQTPPCEGWGGDELGPPACGALVSTYAEACGLG